MHSFPLYFSHAMMTKIVPDRKKILYIDQTLVLDCIVTDHYYPPTTVHWLINGTQIDFEKHRGGVLSEIYSLPLSTSARLKVKCHSNGNPVLPC